MTLRLIVGLGNPGAEYAKTRHNAGFWFVDKLAHKLDAGFARETRFKGLIAKANDLWLLLPQTYMNHSGAAVQAFTQYYRIAAADMLVAHDDLDLPPGAVRLKFGGGLGGHNGLKDISAQLATQDYWRLRLGIGHPGHRDAVVGYVLNPPRQEEATEIGAAIDQALAATPQLLAEDLATAQQTINARRKPAAPLPDG